MDTKESEQHLETEHLKRILKKKHVCIVQNFHWNQPDQAWEHWNQIRTEDFQGGCGNTTISKSMSSTWYSFFYVDDICINWNLQSHIIWLKKPMFKFE